MVWAIKRVRRDSNVSMHQDADLSDIFTAFKTIDELKLMAPSFVARHLDRLPRHGPEEIIFFRWLTGFLLLNVNLQ